MLEGFRNYAERASSYPHLQDVLLCIAT